MKFDDVEIGDDIGPLERVVSNRQVRRFLEIREADVGANRFTDDEFAISEGLPGAIVPGAMNIAMMSQLLTGWSDAVSLRKLDVVFRQPVPHERTLLLKGIVTDKDVVDDVRTLTCDVFLESAEGSKLVIGTATVVLPKQPCPTTTA